MDYGTSAAQSVASFTREVVYECPIDCYWSEPHRRIDWPGFEEQSINITRIGSDANVGNEQKALKMDAFDKVVHNIPAAVEEAEMIILCVPMDEVRKNLEIIAPVLKPGAVVLDTSPLAAPVANWAEGILAKERYLISFKTSLNLAHC